MVGNLGSIVTVMGDPLFDEVQVTPRRSYRSDVEVWILLRLTAVGGGYRKRLPSFCHSDTALTKSSRCTER